MDSGIITFFILFDFFIVSRGCHQGFGLPLRLYGSPINVALCFLAPFHPFARSVSLPPATRYVHAVGKAVTFALSRWSLGVGVGVGSRVDFRQAPSTTTDYKRLSIR